MNTQTTETATKTGAEALAERLRAEQIACVRRNWRAVDMHTPKGGGRVTLHLIGGWADLAGYYEGSDGNAYSLQRLAAYGGDRPRNYGPVAEFRATFAGRLRGVLF